MKLWRRVKAEPATQAALIALLETDLKIIAAVNASTAAINTHEKRMRELEAAVTSLLHERVS